jgi:GNAT superfamily N-acetyltransferase
MAMTRRIRHVEALSEDEWRTLFGWHSDPFGVAHLGLDWRVKDMHFLLELDEQPVSHVGILRHAGRVGTRRVQFAGFGSVITVPHAQRQGHASTLIERATQFVFDEWRVDAGLLFCLPRMLPYYQRLGWVALEHAVLIDQRSGRVAAPIPTMVYPADRCPRLDAPIELESAPW